MPLSKAKGSSATVVLTNELKTYVRKKVTSGQYESASEVIRESLRTLQQHEREQKLFWSETRRKVREARDAVARGDVVDGPTFMRQKIESLAADKSRPRKAKRA